MKNRTFYDGEGVVLAADAVSNDGPVWNQIAKQGSFAGHVSGPFKMDLTTFEEIVTNFKATKNRAVPIDYEHASEQDPTSGSIPVNGAPAQGWIRDLKIEDGNLWGLVEWGAQAREQIRAGQYKFFSPAIVFGKKDRVTGKPCGAYLSSGALVNSPFLDGMKPLAAKDGGDAALLPRHHAGRLRTALSGHNCTERQCCDLRDAASGFLGCYDDADRADGGDGATMPMSDRLTAAEGEASRATLLLAERDQALETLRAENATLLAEKTARHDADVVAAVDQAFATYKDARKLTDAQRPHLLRFAKADLAGFHALYPPVPVHQTYLMRDLVPPARRALPDETPSERVRRSMREEGLTATEGMLRQATGRMDPGGEGDLAAIRAVMKEQNISYTEAQLIAAGARPRAR